MFVSLNFLCHSARLFGKNTQRPGRIAPFPLRREKTDVSSVSFFSHDSILCLVSTRLDEGNDLVHDALAGVEHAVDLVLHGLVDLLSLHDEVVDLLRHAGGGVRSEVVVHRGLHLAEEAILGLGVTRVRTRPTLFVSTFGSENCISG